MIEKKLGAVFATIFSLAEAKRMDRMKKKIIIFVIVSIILILFLFLAFFQWDTGNNYMEELRQVAVQSHILAAAFG